MSIRRNSIDLNELRHFRRNLFDRYENVKKLLDQIALLLDQKPSKQILKDKRKMSSVSDIRVFFIWWLISFVYCVLCVCVFVCYWRFLLFHSISLLCFYAQLLNVYNIVLSLSLPLFLSSILYLVVFIMNDDWFHWASIIILDF